MKVIIGGSLGHISKPLTIERLEWIPIVRKARYKRAHAIGALFCLKIFTKNSIYKS
jgi:hypothetical protein